MLAISSFLFHRVSGLLVVVVYAARCVRYINRLLLGRAVSRGLSSAGRCCSRICRQSSLWVSTAVRS